MKIFDDYEISGCRDDHDHHIERVEDNAEDGPTFWTLYGLRDGIAEAIADRSSRLEAEELYFAITGQTYRGHTKLAGSRYERKTSQSALTNEALDAFWQIIAQHFPPATPGDLSPERTNRLQIAAEGAIEEWISNNVPRTPGPHSGRACEARAESKETAEKGLGMTEASFIGDEWHCRCGNQPHTDGFYPCLRTGQYVEPTPETRPDGDLYRCARCDAIIHLDASTDIGTIVGQTEAQFVDMEQP